MIKNQKGFSHFELIVSVLVIGAIIGIGFIFVNKRNASTKKDESSNSDKKVDTSKSKDSSDQYKWSTQKQGPYQDKISYATSTDLLNWKDSGKIISEHSSVPDALVKDGVIYMYFVDVNTDGIHEQIGLKTSSDKGASWSATTIVKISGLGDETAVDPDPVLLADGKIRLYYYVTRSRDPNDKSKHTVYSAVSSDGKTFKQEAGERFAKEQIVDPDVIKVGDTWRMYVGANGQILSAKSTDGLNFTYEGVAAPGGVPNVYFDGSRYLLFSAGINISTSTDGRTFNSLANGQFKAFPGADPGVVKLANNSYLMVYKINGNTNQPSTPPVN